MKFQIFDGNGLLVSGSKTLRGAKISARAYSKREKEVTFTIRNVREGIEAVFKNNQEQWIS